MKETLGSIDLRLKSKRIRLCIILNLALVTYFLSCTFLNMPVLLIIGIDKISANLAGIQEWVGGFTPGMIVTYLINLIVLPSLFVVYNCFAMFKLKGYFCICSRRLSKLYITQVLVIISFVFASLPMFGIYII